MTYFCKTSSDSVVYKICTYSKSGTKNWASTEECTPLYTSTDSLSTPRTSPSLSSSGQLIAHGSILIVLETSWDGKHVQMYMVLYLILCFYSCSCLFKGQPHEKDNFLKPMKLNIKCTGTRPILSQTSSVADPGCLGSRPGSNNNKKRRGKICCPAFFVSRNVTKFINYFISEKGTEKIGANWQRLSLLFTQKIVARLSDMGLGPGVDQGSGKNLFRIQWSKKHRIPDPEPQHCWLATLPHNCANVIQKL